MAVAFCALSAGSATCRAEVEIEPAKGQATFKIEYTKATDFSGITWLSGEGFYAVSDKVKAMFPMRITIDPDSGQISDAAFVGMIPVKSQHGDFEGVAWQPETQRIYISSENGAIIGFDRDADARFKVNVPPIFQQARRNKSLESLTFGAGSFWTANEDALTVDGPPSSASKGALVRLQKFDSRFRPSSQFAYRTDTSLVKVEKGGTGVSDLCALPDGSLLVLERVVSLGLVIRIFVVDFKGATDTSTVAALEGAEVQPVKKKLLFERSTVSTNFEGIALGPELKDGWRSLLLISDSGGGTTHYLMPLRVRTTDAQK